jgi:peptide-methionine (R)-S-oxide reductase
MKKIMLLLVLLSLTACQGQEKKKNGKDTAKTEASAKGGFTVAKTDAEWKTQLTQQQYNVLRNKDTDRPYTGQYDDFFEKGMYACAACGNPLFISDTKFDSHCGWPSFDRAIKGSVVFETDSSFGMERTEAMCAKCGGHLGHVFDDGPKETTGQRFCTNSTSIKFIAAK